MEREVERGGVGGMPLKMVRKKSSAVRRVTTPSQN